MTSRPALQKILKGILHTKREDKHTMRILGRINLARRMDKQLRIRK
jgi:hypothetical protein